MFKCKVLFDDFNFNYNKYFLIYFNIISFSLYLIITNAQTCYSNIYIITHNNNTTLLALDKYENITNNRYCKCNLFVGDGTALTNQDNQNAIINLISQITALNQQIYNLQQNLSSIVAQSETSIIAIANISSLNLKNQNYTQVVYDTVITDFTNGSYSL